MKKTKGISLIVLVITIIVMIIIAGAIILSLSNTNVIDQAEQAKDKYNLSQLKEAVNLDRTNALLTRYNTTEGVNISVKELFGLTDSDAIELTSTKTMPANMPAGKYYKLDVTKYGMQSAETVENNTIKGAYVINDNYDIYYVVEGTTSEVELPIDDDKVIELLEKYYNDDYEDSAEMLSKLKQELQLQHLEGTELHCISTSFFDENREYAYIYFPTRGKIYSLIDVSESDKENDYKVEYLKREENITIYEDAEKIEQVRSELKAVFVGKTEVEMKAKYDNETLEQYILQNCPSIKSLRLNDNWESKWYFFWDLNFEISQSIGKDEYDFCESNSVGVVLDENNIYEDIYIEYGN